jgi:nucleotide-binding universal stress UspA family protein
MFKNILVCLDGSKLAEQILPYAAEEALRFSGKLTLIEIVGTHAEVPVVSGGGSALAVEAAERQVEREEKKAKAYLRELAHPLREKGLDVKCVTLRALQVGNAIVDYANDKKVELIAVATHGRSGLGRMVFGSVADFVLRESGLPILLIKPKEIDK